jgi:hypothetical protein
MKIMVNNISLYIDAGGFSVDYVQPIADDIGGMLLKAFEGRNNHIIDEIVAICLAVQARIDEKEYNSIIADQIAHQILDYCDNKFCETVISDNDMTYLECHYLTSDYVMPEVTIN